MRFCFVRPLGRSAVFPLSRSAFHAGIPFSCSLSCLRVFSALFLPLRFDWLLALLPSSRRVGLRYLAFPAAAWSPCGPSRPPPPSSAYLCYVPLPSHLRMAFRLPPTLSPLSLLFCFSFSPSFRSGVVLSRCFSLGAAFRRVFSMPCGFSALFTVRLALSATGPSFAALLTFCHSSLIGLFCLCPGLCLCVWSAIWLRFRLLGLLLCF